ncbi:hypothetical protein EWJ91_23175 [Salmonella enterica subsp. enterica serovar Ouagadougou]|uniref:Uncharacterized protein n=1 Tax=Salmonella enterica subsp. enterica serovar Ouagadougou TaxID=2564899 RepID=A0A5I0D5V6_SALET|nr:DUF6258 family protein [Salmonella enterica]EAA7111048.1 hypothetical protein [Salmonella enterica subsp. enterica serovar Ouagadougou]EDU0978115.1 hypothetical protein [Salmonella enterica subsp. enterica serovar Anderlecht]EBR9514354.1 hypothetical protein [Salmonella enterica subsp. enterica serovar Ouagadougou]EBV0637958.1 hypothetical protein [Salmonella enterica subsp. enterica serovar Ouagadougou]EBV0756623.1 hypothetical protein [Salmonella enterica subsp. enterica serovar Ouagadoug
MFDRIYLGDRAIKKIEFELWEKEIRIQINLISRLAYGTTEWNFYNNEDLEDGYFVFFDVDCFSITPEGSIPDDYIISMITDKVNGEYFESIIAVIGQIPNANNGDVDNVGECQIFIRYKNGWIENKFKERIIE